MNIPEKPRYNFAMLKGREFFDSLCMQPPIDPFKVMDKMKYKVILNDLKGQEGFCFWNDYKWCIALDNKVHRNRQKFTAIHELAHIVLGHFDYDFCFNSLAPEKHKVLDIETDVFTGEVIMSLKYIKSCNLHTIKGMANYFQVSEIAMRTRLNFLGMIDILEYKKPNKEQNLHNMFNAINKLGDKPTF